MGYDVSYHPVPEALIRERVMPFITGGRGIDDLVATAVVREKVRHRAKSWALGLFNALPPDGAGAAWFDSDLHVWGRPFLVTADGPEAVSAEVDAYLGATSAAEVDRLAAEAIGRVAPGLRVVPDEEQGPPGDGELAHLVRWKLDLFRAAFANLTTGEPVTDAEENEHDPRELLLNDMPLSVMEFAARFCPGWMDRGHVWPTLVLPRAGVADDLFSSPAALFGPVVAALPELAGELEPTITENYRLGGYVPPERVAELAALVEREAGRISAYTAKAWGEPTPVSVRKWREAICDARRRGCGFVEASEVYSGPMGVMN